MITYSVYHHDNPTDLFLKSLEVTPQSYADLFGITRLNVSNLLPNRTPLVFKNRIDPDDSKQFELNEKEFTPEKAEISSIQSVTLGQPVTVGWAGVTSSFLTVILCFGFFINTLKTFKYKREYRVTHLS